MQPQNIKTKFYAAFQQFEMKYWKTLTFQNVFNAKAFFPLKSTEKGRRQKFLL
jgi:hypothetical protein